MKTSQHTRKGFVISTTRLAENLFIFTIGDMPKSHLQHHLKEVDAGAKIVLQYGGNSCNFDWKSIASSPEGYHLPKRSIDAFESIYKEIIDQILAHGCTPIIATLPALLPQRHFDHISHGLNRGNILQWLHHDVNTLSNYHELHNQALKQLAQEREIRLMDISNILIDQRSLGDGYSRDGMHPNKTGQSIINNALLATFFAEK
ncbi:MAG: hypothetical protein MJZ99_00945 [Bacteroidales bacterium]|nr:hypothetical protein [Bacteroidales bacterium]